MGYYKLHNVASLPYNIICRLIIIFHFPDINIILVCLLKESLTPTLKVTFSPENGKINLYKNQWSKMSKGCNVSFKNQHYTMFAKPVNDLRINDTKEHKISIEIWLYSVRKNTCWTSLY